jgi:hypothetical protein
VVEPGTAFDAAEWESISKKIESSILTGIPRTGRDYSFSTFPVLGQWRGKHSGVQIIPPPNEAPRAPGASNPFILEFPIKGSDLWPITNHRRIREHGKLTLLLNLLLAGTTNAPLRRTGHFWAAVDRQDGSAGPPNIKWVHEWYYAPLDRVVIDQPSACAAERLGEVDPEEYYTNVGNDGSGLRVPADLDGSICCYLGLSTSDRAKFDRATFWLGIASRHWNGSVSSSFAALVSAIEALTERAVPHQFDCPICGKPTQHEVPGATRRFKDFIEKYAPGGALAKRRDEMYSLRSGILHGSKLIELDQALAFWVGPTLVEPTRIDLGPLEPDADRPAQLAQGRGPHVWGLVKVQITVRALIVVRRSA